MLLWSILQCGVLFESDPVWSDPVRSDPVWSDPVWSDLESIQ
jgi:hypothetical protein